MTLGGQAMTFAVDDLLRDHQSLHSDLQIDAWILNEGNPTDWGRYQQALRELHSRRAAVESLSREADLALLDLEECRRAKPWFGAVRRRRWAIRLEDRRCRLRDLLASLAEHRREFERFHAAAAELRGRLGEITPALRAEYDRELWIARIRQMAAVDLATNGRVGPALVKMVAALPADLRKRALDETRDPQRLLASLEIG